MAINSPAAQVTAAGISSPSYADILSWLQNKFRSIYGSDTYLEPDSQDGQWLAILSQAFSDCNNLAVSVYNAFSPSTAQGNGLSSVVKINGLTRLVPSKSTCPLYLVGQAGTTIANGIVGDGTNKWDLPALVTISVSGDITVTATAQLDGNLTAAAGTLSQIITPTLGWQSVTNLIDATPGQPVEDDATLRRRQSVSTGQAALTVTDALRGSVSNLTGVSACEVFENDTPATNSLGIPRNSVSLVVKGGDVLQIAQTIAAKKAPGTGTYGTISEKVFDDKGVPNTINFFQPSTVTITASIKIKALTGYVSTTGTELMSKVASYISGLGISAGDFAGTGKVYLWQVGAVAALMGTGLETTFNVTEVKLSRTGAGGLATADIAIAFNELAACDASSNITLTVT